MKITFVCEDAGILEFYERYWRGRFEAELADYKYYLSLADKSDLLTHWDTLMRADARRQEHYAYNVVDGKRVVVFETQPHAGWAAMRNQLDELNLPYPGELVAHLSGLITPKLLVPIILIDD